jgi:hypothetical protein
MVHPHSLIQHLELAAPSPYLLEFGVFDAKLNKKNLNKSQFALAEGA